MTWEVLLYLLVLGSIVILAIVRFQGIVMLYTPFALKDVLPGSKRRLIWLCYTDFDSKKVLKRAEKY